MRITSRLNLSRTLNMALHAPSNQPKLICES